MQVGWSGVVLETTMGIFSKRKSDDLVALAEFELGQLTERERHLEQRLAAAQAALDEAKAARLVLLTDTAKPLDAASLNNADARCMQAEATHSGLAAALLATGEERAAAEERLWVVQQHAVRIGEADRVAPAATRIGEVLEEFMAAAEQLAATLDGSQNPTAIDGPNAAIYLRNFVAAFDARARAVVTTLSEHERKLRDPTLIAPRATPSEPRTRVLSLEYICWTENGQVRTVPPWQQIDLPDRLLGRASARNLVEPFGTPRAAALVDGHGQQWGPGPAPGDRRLVDLDSFADQVQTPASLNAA
jgi:hypothetical protein